MDFECLRQIMFIDITFNRSLSILMADPQEFLKLSDEQLTAFIIDFEARLQEYLRNMRVGLDCANGSAWMIAKNVFDALGAKTYFINAEPNDININNNASPTHIEGLQALVKETELDVGFAYDGDADSCL